MKQLVQRSLRSLGYEMRRYSATTGPLGNRPSPPQSLSAPVATPPATPSPAPLLRTPKADEPGEAFLAQQSLLQKFGVRRPTILDIGANSGQTAARYSQLFPNSRIYSFEPFPQAYDKLVETVGELPNVFAINKAVSDTAGRRALHVMESSATNSLLPRPSTERRYFPTRAGQVRTTEVEVTTIDEFVREADLESIDLLKLDTQGGELMAFRGATETLRRQVPIIYTEAMFVPHYENQPLLHHLWGYLEPLGYSLYQIFDLVSAPTNGQLRYGDALFVHRSVRTAVLDAAAEEP